MKSTRVVFLLFRYGILVLTGGAIAFLWKTCQLEHYETWGRFYAFWIPILYAIFSTGYVLFEAASFSDQEQPKFRNLRTYDDYTYLLPLLFFALELAAPYGSEFYFWLSVFYLALIVIKGGLLLVYLYTLIRATSSHQSQTDPFLDPVPRNIHILLVLTTLIIYSLISAYHVRRTSLTGDEPHYLLITHSLWHDHDMDLYNNYNNRDYTSFFWHELQPASYDQVTCYRLTESSLNMLRNEKLPETVLKSLEDLVGRECVAKNTFLTAIETQIGRAQGNLYEDLLLEYAEKGIKIYSYRHKGGFPHTLIPGYVLGGQLGTVLQINLITSLLMLQVFLLSYELFHSLSASFYTWLCVAFSIPFIIYMGQIYPETLAALLTIWVVRRVRILHANRQKSIRALGLPLLWNALAIIALALLKTRYVPIAGVLLLFLILGIFWKGLDFKKMLKLLPLIIIIPVVIVAVVLFVDTYFLGNMLRDRITDTRYMDWMFSGYNPLFGLLGLFFDQEYGLLTYTPLYLFALVGIGLLTRKEWKASFPIIVIFVLNYAAICFWPLWHAAPTPPARYILPVLPLLGIFLARFFTQKHGLTNTIILGIGIIWSFLTFWVVTLNPWWRYNWADGTNNLLEMLSWQLAMNLTKIFPSWIRISPLTPYLTILGIAGIGVMIYLGRVQPGDAVKRSLHALLETRYIALVAVFVMLSTGAFVLGRNLPTMVLEAEDLLDMRAQGGEQIPLANDPWHNQLYLRKWKYYGWKLSPGSILEARPKLYRIFPSARRGTQTAWELRIYARVQLDKRHPTDLPMMIVFMNEKEVGRIAVSSIGWNVYPFTLLVEEPRPKITISHEYKPNSQSALIIDKVGFR